MLYSITPNYYKKTLVGNILGYLDYFLKGFVNGGFFKEDFVQNCYLNKNEDNEYLNSNFINLKKYIYNNKNKIPNHDIYLTVYCWSLKCQDDQVPLKYFLHIIKLYFLINSYVLLQTLQALESYIPQFGYVSTCFFFGHINFNVRFFIIFSGYEIIIDLNSLL